MSPKTNKQFEEIREKSKENILRSALHLFSEKGYFSTSVRQIAQQAKVSSGLMYNYFSSKESLLRAITEKALSIIDDIVDTDEVLSPEDNLRKMIERFFEVLDTKRKLLRMMLKISFQIERFDFVKEMIERKYQLNVKDISRHLQALGYDNPEAEASLLIATMDGAMYQSLTLGKMIPIDAIRQQLIYNYCTKSHTSEEE